MKNALRSWVVALALSSSAAWAQGSVDACTQRCASSMGGCMAKCESSQKCAGHCNNRMNDCTMRCAAAPEKQGKKDKKCTGADGKRMPCFEKTAKPDTKLRPEPEEVYPNKAAEDLAKDPEFKVDP